MVQDMYLPTKRLNKMLFIGTETDFRLITLAYHNGRYHVIRRSMDCAMIQQIVKSEMIRGFVANFHLAAHELLLSLQLMQFAAHLSVTVLVMK